METQPKHVYLLFFINIIFCNFQASVLVLDKLLTDRLQFWELPTRECKNELAKKHLLQFMKSTTTIYLRLEIIKLRRKMTQVKFMVHFEELLESLVPLKQRFDLLLSISLTNFKSHCIKSSLVKLLFQDLVNIYVFYGKKLWKTKIEDHIFRNS